LLFFVTAALPAADAAAEPGNLSFSLSTAPSLSVGKDPRFTAEGQFSLPSAVTFTVDTESPWSWHLTAGYRYTGPSPAGVNEFTLRSHNDFLLGTGAAFRWPVLYEKGILRLSPALAVNGYGQIGVYQDTSIYFFYPSLEVEPRLRVLRFMNGFVLLTAGLPLRCNFRRDLSYSLSLGFSFDIALYLPEN
jgi:hypothetical protein